MKLFVYGTLKPGEERHVYVEDHLDRTYPATVLDCQMYDLGPFPALIRWEGAVTHGVVLECNDVWEADYLLGITDQIEGSMYSLRPITTVNNEEAWTYLFNAPAALWDSDYPVIERWSARQDTNDTTNEEN